MQQRSGHSETAMDVELDVRTDRGEYVGGDTIYGYSRPILSYVVAKKYVCFIFVHAGLFICV